jgi:hypothetical protein
MSAGFSPDLLKISSHSADKCYVRKLPFLSMQTELDFTTFRTTDSAFGYGFLKIPLILPKNEFSLRFRNSSSAWRFFSSIKASFLGANCSSFFWKMSAYY